MPSWTPIERIAPPSPEEFEARYVKPSRPVILRGAIDEWPAMKRWSIAQFKERFGERRVPAVRTRGGTMYTEEGGLHYEKVRFADYCDLLDGERASDLYMLFRVHEQLPELMDDVIRPDYCRDAGWYRSRFWFAARDTKGPFHRDMPENLYAQISGRKQFLLVDKRQTRYVPLHAAWTGVPSYSPIDAEAPDLEKWPKFGDAEVMVADLEPGDLFFIPSLWWHQAHSQTTSISVNLWWVNGPMVWLARAAELYMKVRDLQLLALRRCADERSPRSRSHDVRCHSYG